MKRLLTALFAFWIGLACAQPDMEIIELKSRNVDQVLPALRPLLEPGGTLIGMGNQLFLRASPRNRSEIRQALAALDKPARQLIIRISQNRAAEHGQRGAAADGQVVLGSSSLANVDARVWDSRSLRNDSGEQRVRAMAGSQAFIQVGRSLPVPMRQVVIGANGAVINETIVYRDIGQGFYAVPQVNGNQVTLEISQQADTAGGYGQGAIHTQRLATTVSGRLGEWIELGGSGQQSAGREDGAFTRSTRDVHEQRAIWLKVEEAD